MKRALILSAAGLAALVLVLVVNALRVPDRPAPTGQAARLAAVDTEAVANHLSEAIRIPTVSRTNEPHFNHDVFIDFHDWLEASYPATHAALEREVIDGESLLYTWRGRDEGRSPVAFLAHMDVVPVEEGTDGEWTHPPFAGQLADGFVWGRGTLDMKGTLVTLMEAVEQLAARGFTPERTVYLAFGHDEEVGGLGAVANARVLSERGVALEWSLDEGGVLIENPPGLGGPAASVGIAEKGYLTLQVIAHGTGGHSSMPHRESAAGRLATAIVALEQEPFPASIGSVIGDMMNQLATALPFSARLVLANRWLFDPLIELALEQSPPFAAMLRTTTAVTMLEASPQENVLAQEAVATVNFRIIPGETIDSVQQRVSSIVGSEHIEVRPAGTSGFRSNPSAVASIEVPGYTGLERSIAAVFPDALVMPGLVVGATDSRHFQAVADDSYRFAPLRIAIDQAGGVHGTDERVAIDALGPAVQFYIHLFETALGSGS